MVVNVHNCVFLGFSIPGVLQVVNVKHSLNGWLLVCKPADRVATKDSSVRAFERLCLLTVLEITASKVKT